MISSIPNTTTQSRATKAKSSNFRSRNVAQTNLSSQDVFAPNSQVNLTKSASIKRLQPIKPLKTTSFGNRMLGGPILNPREVMLFQDLFHAQQKFYAKLGKASEHSDLEEIMGLNPQVDKKELSQARLDVAKAYNQFGQKSPFGRASAYVFALKAAELDEGNPHIHNFIKNDLKVPLERAFEEKTDAILNAEPITMQDAHLPVLSSENEAKAFFDYHSVVARIKQRSAQTNEDAQMSEILGEEPQIDKKAFAKDMFDLAKATLAFGKEDSLARVGAYQNAMQSIEIDANNPEVHFFLASKVGVSPQEALHHVTEAVRQKPYNIEYLQFKMAMQGLLGQDEDFMKTAERAISVSPKDTSLRLLRAAVHEKLGNHNGAIIDYKTIAELEPQNVVSRTRLGAIAMKTGNSTEEAKWFDEAEKAFHSVDKANRTSMDIETLSNAFVNRGANYLDTAQLKPAKESFTKALEVRPDMMQARYNRALVDCALGNHEESIKDLDIFLKNNDAIEKPHLHVLASALKALDLTFLGKDEEAGKFIKMTKREFPDYPVDDIITETFSTLTGLGK